MACGAGINVIAMALMVIACLGITDNADRLVTFSWVIGNTKATGWKMHMGVTSRVDRVDCGRFPNPTQCAAFLLVGGMELKSGTEYRKVTKFEGDGCSAKLPDGVVLTEAQTAAYAGMAKSCTECKDSMLASNTLILGLITTWPSIMTNLQRATPFGDINCQATAGSVVAIFSFCNTLVALVKYAFACKDNMPGSIIGLSGEVLEIEWSFGAGYICLLIATILKFVDIVLHFSLPTPQGRWKAPDTPPNNVTEFLWLAVPKQEGMGGPATIQVGKSDA